MTPFAALLERLAFTPARSAKLRLIADYLAEWKWDGVRVQAVAEGGVRRPHQER